MNQAYSRLSTTHGQIIDCKLDSVVYAGVCVVIFNVDLSCLGPNDLRLTICADMVDRYLASLKISVNPPAFDKNGIGTDDFGRRAIYASAKTVVLLGVKRKA